MKDEILLVEDVFDLFRTKLIFLYPKEEIDSFVRIVLNEVGGLTDVDLLLNKNQKLQSSGKKKVLEILDELITGNPLQYVLGHTEFYGLTLKVTPDVLIPRPETEELVDLIIKDQRVASKLNIKLIDIGTGSGCIPIALKKNLKNTDVTAIDISKDALNIAKENAARNQTSIKFIQSDILNRQNFHDFGVFDIIVSNPPYVTESEKKLLHKNVLDYEPALALFVDDADPLVYYRAIFDFSIDHLKKPGAIYLEMNENLGAELVKLAKAYHYLEILLIKDLNNKDRILKMLNFEC